MPFITTFNKNRIIKQLTGQEIDPNIDQWSEFVEKIPFLNMLEKTKLKQIRDCCENPSLLDTIYMAVNIDDKYEYIYKEKKPCYHKFENCKFLKSKFENYKLPSAIKDQGISAIDKFRTWFIEHEAIFRTNKEDYYNKLSEKFGITTPLSKVDYRNSGYTFDENLSEQDLESRIKSLLKNERGYKKSSPHRKSVMDDFYQRTYLAFRKKPLPKTIPGISEEEIRYVLSEYHHLFVNPTIGYLEEYYKVSNESRIEFKREKLESLNFRPCGNCYNVNYNKNPDEDSRIKILIDKYGDYKFPLRSGLFYPKNNIETNTSTAFIYATVFFTKTPLKEDETGNYKLCNITYVNSHNQYKYDLSKIREQDLGSIELYESYLTKIEKNNTSNEVQYTTFCEPKKKVYRI